MARIRKNSYALIVPCICNDGVCVWLRIARFSKSWEAAQAIDSVQPLFRGRVRVETIVGPVVESDD